jgi:hypothetical protein
VSRDTTVLLLSGFFCLVGALLVLFSVQLRHRSFLSLTGDNK